MANPSELQNKPLDRDRQAGSEHTETLTATEARQGFRGRRVLIVLLGGIILAMLAWIPVEWWGNSMAPEQPQVQQTAPSPATNNAPAQPATQP